VQILRIWGLLLFPISFYYALLRLHSVPGCYCYLVFALFSRYRFFAQQSVQGEGGEEETNFLLNEVLAFLFYLLLSRSQTKEGQKERNRIRREKGLHGDIGRQAGIETSNFVASN